MWSGAERKQARRFADIAANAPSSVFEYDIMYFFIPAVDGNVQTAGLRPGPEMAGTGDFQHRIATRSDLGHLREEMGARDLLILIKQIFPDFSNIVFLETMVVVSRRIDSHDL